MIKIRIDPTEKILARRKLNKNGQAQRFFTSEFKRHADPYVPFLLGPLKNTAKEEIDQIRYIQKYSAVNYFKNRGNGLRGKMWDRRMWATRGPDIVSAVANFIGGKRR